MGRDGFYFLLEFLKWKRRLYFYIPMRGDTILSELSKVVKKDFLQVSIGLIERVALRGMLLYMVGEPPRSGLSL